MNLAKRIRDLRYSKGWGPDELASRAKISRTALYQIERGNTSKPQAGTLRRISRALGVPLEILLDSTPVLGEAQGQEGVEAAPMLGVGVERAVGQDRAEELIEKFRRLLSSPMAEGIARIVEESYRLLPIIPPPVAAAPEPAPRFAAAPAEPEAPRRTRGRPRAAAE
ncbi:Helix-turn-helix domain protein [Aquisphaera giovannonii]|uniref:Helix-turn-helix domain protein n=1 Tax=Aquisphaera giovannonii TaxID=406548 RepID=A0A5B9W6Y7_9BACT|nr:helix-turn-helix transcriptional regulator [Aquisphaera giovannonii]QEH35845.1 Helix-turn-helix domain protein [Aquisphaera giovannonii]